jgi:hypothetical protein
MPEFFPPLTRRAEYTGEAGIAGYRRYRAEIRADCVRRCVYCDCPEDLLGGGPMMELDHFRPQKHYPDLDNDPTNLVYSCRSCNNKKRADWPAGKGAAATHVGGEGYLDMFAVQRNIYLHVVDSGELQALQPPAMYLIRRLALNRPLMRYLRRRAILQEALQRRLAELIPKVEKRIATAEVKDKPLFQEILDVLRQQQAFNATVSWN